VKPLAAVPALPALDDAEKWNAWVCPGCGDPMQQPKNVPPALSNVNGPCHDCQERIRARQETPQRTVTLERAGCPPKYLIPFLEPQPWPADPVRPGVNLGAWGGEPWACTLSGEASPCFHVFLRVGGSRKEFRFWCPFCEGWWVKRRGTDVRFLDPSSPEPSSGVVGSRA
jgi:hypothetical protein